MASSFRLINHPLSAHPPRSSGLLRSAATCHHSPFVPSLTPNFLFIKKKKKKKNCSFRPLVRRCSMPPTAVCPHNSLAQPLNKRLPARAVACVSTEGYTTPGTILQL